MQGYNSVVAVIKLTTTTEGTLFMERFVSSVIGPASNSPLMKKMSFSCGNMAWETMGPDWSPRDNITIRHESIEEPDVESFVSRNLSAPLDLRKPCWAVEYLEEVFEESRSYSVCILKYHHAVADGFTMIQQMLSRVQSVSDPSTSVFSMFPHRKANAAKSSGSVWSVLKSLWRMMRMKPDKPSIYRSTTLRVADESLNVALSDLGGVTVDRLKRLAKQLSEKGVYSINDILTAALAMALRSFALKRGKTPEDVTSVIWVSLEREFAASICPNKWDNSKLGFGYASLPLSVQSPMESLRVTHGRLSVLKESPDAGVINWALRLIGSLPVSMGKFLSLRTADKASISMSNLAGPNQQVRWPVGLPGEAPIIESIHFVTSPPFHFGLLASFLSYDGKFFVSLSARAQMFEETELTSLLKEELPRAVCRLEGDAVEAKEGVAGATALYPY